jgi:hypothetical protein
MKRVSSLLSVQVRIATTTYVKLAVQREVLNVKEWMTVASGTFKSHTGTDL